MWHNIFGIDQWKGKQDYHSSTIRAVYLLEKYMLVQILIADQLKKVVEFNTANMDGQNTHYLFEAIIIISPS